MRRRGTFSGLLSGADEYGISHRPNPEGPPLHNMLEGGLAPFDIYTAPASWYTGYAELVGDTVWKMRSLRGKPDAKVRIYRAGPTAQLNPGDWVSLSRPYTDQHRDAMDPESYKTCWFTVRAKEVRWAGDDLMEWGYYGPPKKSLTGWSGCYKNSLYRASKS